EIETEQTTIKVEQVDLVVSPTMPKISEDTIMVQSPSLAMGLLISDNINNNEFCHQQQLSPFTRTLSNVVAPFIFDNESLRLFENEYDSCPTSLPMQYWPMKIIDDTYIKYQFEQELASIDALINEF
ncbi:unnamed protein product, partial [Rotaria sp. Silwood2]